MASGLHRWLFEGVDRDRLLDMDRRLAPARRNALAVLAVALLLGSPWLGPWTLAPLLLAAGLFGLATRLAGKSTHPEDLILGAWIATEAIIALAVAVTGGPQIATMGWLAIPIVTLFRFSERLAKIGAVIALTMLGTVAFATDPGAVIHDPPLLIAPAATIVAIAMLLVALIRSDTEHRTECVIDGLTGLLNRKAAESRAAELEQQAALTGEPVALIAIDLDRFKRINDDLGHAAGDAALAEVAYRFRKCLRAYDLVYRLGGEEFLVIVPGAGIEEAIELAEQLRAALASEPLSTGRRVTISAGVSSSTRGETFSYRDVLREADLALYAAKESGRNRVCHAKAERDTWTTEPGVLPRSVAVQQ
jgi:diguanylate cyclase (GGDEF)-like protein